MCITITKKLGLDCPGAQHMMLSMTIQYKDVFASLKQRDCQYSMLASDDKWKLAKNICDELELFY